MVVLRILRQTVSVSLLPGDKSPGYRTYLFEEVITTSKKVTFRGCIYDAVEERVNSPREVPCLERLGTEAFTLRPRRTIRKRAEARELPDSE